MRVEASWEIQAGGCRVVKSKGRDVWQTGAHVWAEAGILDAITHKSHINCLMHSELQCSERGRNETRPNTPNI